MVTSKSTSIVIPSPRIGVMEVKIRGTAPLIFNRFSEKAKQMILDKQMKKASKGREAKNPEELYRASYYYNAAGKIAFPALCLKQSIVDASRNIEGVTMTLLRGAVFVVGDSDGLIEVEYSSEVMREDMVRVGMGSADIRFRGQCNDWKMKFLVKFNEDVLSSEMILNLIQIAGFSGGLGEWRPEKNGDFGTYELDMDKND